MFADDAALVAHSDSKLAFLFLDTAVSKEQDGRLTTSVYRKPTNTDEYLAYDSHHPQSVKRGIAIVDRAKHIVTKPFVISKGKEHLSSVLVSNGYPLFLSCRELPRPENGTPRQSPRPSSKPPWFYLTSKVGPSNFDAAYNSKTYALSSSQKLRQDQT